MKTATSEQMTRPTEIDVTAEMIEAGWSAFARFAPVDGNSVGPVRKALVAAFRAMDAARPAHSVTPSMTKAGLSVLDKSGTVDDLTEVDKLLVAEIYQAMERVRSQNAPDECNGAHRS